MDKKGWLILALCGAGLVFLYNSMVQQNKAEALLEKNSEVLVNKENAKEPAEGEVGTVTQDSIPNKNVVEEKLISLTSVNAEGKEVKYVFTNLGGGLKEVQLGSESAGPDGGVVINKYGNYPIGSLADAEGEFANYHYPLAAITQDNTSVTFTRTSKSGLQIIKKWELATADVDYHEYRLTLNVVIKNLGEEAVKLKNYSLISGVTAPVSENERADLSRWFFYDDNGFEKPGMFGDPFKDGFLWGEAKSIDIHTVQDLEFAGVSNQFFTTIITPEDAGNKIWVTPKSLTLEDSEKELRSFNLGIALPNKDIIPQTSESFKFEIYTGPRKQAIMNKLGENTSKVMGYGWFGFGAPYMNIALNWLHDYIGNNIYEPWSWGISIILLTICIRILIWPLYQKSTRSMKRMSKLQPHMKEIKEKYPEDPQKVQQETLKLYKKFGVNPVGGCLPMLVQMPIFFAVFGMLTNAVELRGQDFIWVTDLSQQEAIWMIPFIDVPLNILPITMAATMVIQMQMTPSSGDAMQKKIFMFMPIIFFFFCYSYAAALALYWTVQNIVSIIQTLIIKRIPEPELVEITPKETDPSKPRKKGFMERLAEKLEEAQQKRETELSKKTGKPVKQAKKQPVAPGQKPDKDKKHRPKTGG